jgi:hypothetical protein
MPRANNAERRRNTKARMTPAVSLIRPFAGFCGGLAVLSIFWRDWIEALTGYDPDRHDGTVKWLIVVAPLVNRDVLAVAAAHAEWRRPRRPLSVARAGTNFGLVYRVVRPLLV